MARVSDSYYCSHCEKEVPASEVRRVGTLGLMHDVDGCRSGRVAPVWRENQEKS